jgi:hypothetical protein
MTYIITTWYGIYRFRDLLRCGSLRSSMAYKSVVPLPARPISYAPAMVAGWFVAGGLVLVVMKLIGQEQWLLRAGSATND